MSQYIYGPMEGATTSANGAAGLVPAPLIADKDKILKGDGSWSGVENLPTATTSANGIMSSTDKAKLDAISGIQPANGVSF